MNRNTYHGHSKIIARCSRGHGACAFGGSGFDSVHNCSGGSVVTVVAVEVALQAATMLIVSMVAVAVHFVMLVGAQP